MAETDSEDRTFEASARKLAQARERGEVPVSREGAQAGVYIAALVAIVLTAGTTVAQIRDILLPMLDQPDGLINATPAGLQAAALAVCKAIGLAIAPVFALLIGATLLPYVLQGSITLSLERLGFKPSHLSPAEAVKRTFSPRALFEFAKSLLKVLVIAVTCYVLARPLYQESMSLVGADFSVLPHLLQAAVTKMLLAATLSAVIIAGVDVPFQHLSFLRRMRMTREEMKEEMRSVEGDPHVKGRLKRLRRQRARRRMMHDVPKATVVITNPTHVAVALRYERGKDAAPVVLAKGADLVALRIKEVARKSDVPISESPPLARALYSAVEIGEMIPREHFEAVAKIIGIVWARRQKGTFRNQN
ncbi:EscU/YscU/HrcU family type III secretion system export apparatus switch protein [Rhodopila globiformis]|uniref:EscU/YscU/HrcU family type III secretion system export apparatus switch protein n=1 Tax=Rhodopila globiformis TaxID=1071 RepID=UPI001304F8B5|nr:flagellar type III secretion system protein FlhB [Rhodopila globiformis]